jgi:uridylate kinase
VTQTPVVLSIGGSVLAGDKLEPDRIQAMANAIDARVDLPVGITVGGGYAARRYIRAARELDLDEAGLDTLGVQITRANAWLLIAAFEAGVYPTPAEEIDEAAQAMGSFDRVCIGGTHPGHTTDAVAAMLAERVDAQRLVIVTNVDGVYTSDPREDASAERYEEVGTDELVQLAGQARDAGSSTVVDPLAAQIIQRSSLPTRVVSGDEPDNVADAAEGRVFDGTRVTPE